MAAFYVLPARAALGEALARFLRPAFPGLEITSQDAAGLLEQLVEGRAGYFVHREDLPEGDVASGLRDGYGAEPGDQIVHVGIAALSGQPGYRIERIGDAAVPAAA